MVPSRSKTHAFSPFKTFNASYGLLFVLICTAYSNNNNIAVNGVDLDANSTSTPTESGGAPLVVGNNDKTPRATDSNSMTECPKFEEGHCQCARADAKNPDELETTPGFRSAPIPGILGEVQNSSASATAFMVPPAGPNGGGSSNTSGPQQFNIACSFTKSEVIRAALKKVAGLNVSTLTLVHNVIPVLENNFFEELTHLDRLVLKYNRITNISEDAFRGPIQKSLKTLLIDEFYWYSFHFKAFDSVPSKALRDLKNLKEFTVSSGYLTNVTKDMLYGLTGLERLTLKGYKLANIQDDAFADLANLKSLELKSSNLAAIPVKPFKRITPLEELKIESRKIQTINGSSFASLGKLTKLDLSSCSIHTINDEAFDGLTSLKYLFLDRNSLKTVPRALSSLKSLEVLDFGYNDLQTLEPNSFIALSNLKNLTLDMNGLITVPEESLRGLEYNLEYLSLMQNRLTQFPSKALNNLKKLNHLSLTSNMIIEIPADALTHPNEIDGKEGVENKGDGKSKSTNGGGTAKSSTGGRFTPIKLMTLDLSRNRISKISGQAFKGSRDSLDNFNLAINKLVEYPVEFGEFSNLTSLDLSLNNIQTLKVEALEGSQDRLEFLGISGNPWRCDCNMASFRTWLEDWVRGLTLRDMYKMEKMIRETKCESPDDLKGIPLHYPTIGHLVCDGDSKDASKSSGTGGRAKPGSSSTTKGNASSRLPVYYFVDPNSPDFVNAFDGEPNSKYASHKKSFYEKWYLYKKNRKLLNNLESTRTLALMGFLMSLILCVGLLSFALMSCLGPYRRAAGQNGPRGLKALFSKSKSNVSINSDGLAGTFPPNMIMMSANDKSLSPPAPGNLGGSNKGKPAKPFFATSAPRGGGGGGTSSLAFMQPSRIWGGSSGNKRLNEYDIDNEGFEDDKRAITKHEFDMPSADNNPYGPTTIK